MIIWQLAMCPHNYGTFRTRTWQAGGPAKASSRLEAAPGGRPGHLSKSGGKCFSKSGRQETGALGDKYFQIKCGLLLLLSIVKINYFHFSYIDILLYTSQYREWRSSPCQPVKNIILLLIQCQKEVLLS